MKACSRWDLSFRLKIQLLVLLMSVGTIPPNLVRSSVEDHLFRTPSSFQANYFSLLKSIIPDNSASKIMFSKKIFKFRVTGMARINV